MTELEHRALMGDKQAQQECTEKGIALACPFCGGGNVITSSWGMSRTWCRDCKGKSDDQLTRIDAIKAWNTRPAPPIGQCGDCVHYEFGACLKIYDDGHAHPEAFQHRKSTDFCSYFNPKERE